MSQGLRLPFRDRWFVMHGGDTLNVNHHMAVEAQWYALDFAKVGGATGRVLATKSPPECADFYGWGAQVLAPVDATVVAAEDGWPDNSVGTTDPEHPLGNHIVLQHNDRFYWLAHLQRGSLAVRRADRVDQGGVLALCGNSGNSDFPHVHLHGSRSQVFGQGRGENLIFSSIDVELTGARFANVNWPLIRGLFVANHLAGGSNERRENKAALDRARLRRAHLSDSHASGINLSIHGGRVNIAYVMYAIFALAVGSMLYRIVKHRGFRGALFGAPVRSTVAELELQARGMVKTRLKVYQLDGHATNNDIGLEIVHTTVGSWQAVPVSLTAAEARQLAEALELAARESEAFVAAG